MLRALAWTVVGAAGAYAIAVLAVLRGESVNAIWFIVAAAACYAIAYRFYGAFLAARVFALDARRLTPAERINDGRDFVPTNRWVVFGHHFAPSAMLMGWYMKAIRPHDVRGATLIGLGLLAVALLGGRWVDQHPVLGPALTLTGPALAWTIILYGFAASTLPVWLLLAPRDYLSTFVKLGTVALLALGIIIMRPEIQLPAITRFVDGTGPIFAGKVFPFCFITIACGAISGFHSLISSGTTPKLLSEETDAPMIGYGGMLLESFVAIMAMIAAAWL